MARKKATPPSGPVDAALVQKLAAVPMFSHLSPAALGQLASVGVREEFGRGAMVVKEGSAGDSMYLVLSGQVQVQKSINERESITIGTMGPGDLFGEMGLFEKMPRAASVLAQADGTHLFSLGREQFDTFLGQQGAGAGIILRDVINLLSHRLREAREELRVVYEISEVVASVDGVVALGDGVLGKLLNDIPESASGLLAAWPEFSEDATVVSARDLPADRVDAFSLHRNHPLAVELDHKSTPFILSDLADDHPLAWMVSGEGGSVLLSPMMANDRLHGFLALVARPGEHFSGFDVQLMSIVANIVAMSFLHALQLQEQAAQERKTRVYYGQVH